MDSPDGPSRLARNAASLQDLSGGVPILVEGTDLPLWGMEIDTEREKERFKAWSAGEPPWGWSGPMQLMLSAGFVASAVRPAWL